MNEIIVIDISKIKPIDLGKKTFKHMPRLDEWIELEEGGKDVMFKVVMVVHASTGAGCDLYVRRLDFAANAIRQLM